MSKEDLLLNEFKTKLIEQIKQETEQEIQKRVAEFENHLREMASAKIVSFVDELKIIIKRDLDSIEPKMIIEVHL